MAAVPHPPRESNLLLKGRQAGRQAWSLPAHICVAGSPSSQVAGEEKLNCSSSLLPASPSEVVVVVGKKKHEVVAVQSPMSPVFVQPGMVRASSR